MISQIKYGFKIKKISKAKIDETKTTNIGFSLYGIAYKNLIFKNAIINISVYTQGICYK